MPQRTAYRIRSEGGSSKPEPPHSSSFMPHSSYDQTKPTSDLVVTPTSLPTVLSFSRNDDKIPTSPPTESLIAASSRERENRRRARRNLVVVSRERENRRKARRSNDQIGGRRWVHVIDAFPFFKMGKVMTSFLEPHKFVLNR
ncbi:hypothetical protein LguiA_003189 [Lonicera macranthoides]